MFGPGLQRRVGERLGDEPRLDRARLAMPQQLHERGRSERRRAHRGIDAGEFVVGRDDHVEVRGEARRRGRDGIAEHATLGAASRTSACEQ